MQKSNTYIEDGIIYYNASLENSISTSTKPLQAILNQNLNVPILSNAKEYNLAVERFSVDTSLIPIFLCPVVLGQVDINLTPFTISYKYNGFTVTKHVIFNTQIADATRPAQPILTQDFSTGYYNIFTINHLLGVINQCFVEVAADMHLLDATFPSPSVVIPNQPYITFNFSTNMFELIAPLSYSTATSGIDIETYINTALYNYLGLQALSINLNDPQLNYYLNIADNYGNGAYYTYPTSVTANGFVKMVADHRAVDRWSPLSKIVITSTSLQTRGEFIQPSINYGQLSTTTLGSETSKIITDFEPDYYNGPIQNRNFVQYGVTGVANYRLIEFNVTGVSEIRNFNIQFWWADNYGNVYPLFLSIGGGFSIKFAFTPKNLIIKY